MHLLSFKHINQSHLLFDCPEELSYHFLISLYLVIDVAHGPTLSAGLLDHFEFQVVEGLREGVYFQLLFDQHLLYFVLLGLDSHSLLELCTHVLTRRI